MTGRGRPRIEAFNLEPGDTLTDKYEVIEKLGAGWEGEVYLVSEMTTRIDRTVKLFFPQRNVRDATSKFYAKKLHKLRHCPIVIQYHTQDTIWFDDVPIRFLVSEFVDGELLSQFMKRQPGQRLQPFQAVHLLHALVSGMECIHRAGEYHGDLHIENIIVQRYGLEFELKLLDMFHWGPPKAENRHDDVADVIRLFYDVLGGQRHYANQPDEVKAICCGLKRSLIIKKYRTMTRLRQHLETMEWE
ncbi:MAG: protein kinase [Gemmatimonadota bacterium]|jgi:serine/threonine protein kinase